MLRIRRIAGAVVLLMMVPSVAMAQKPEVVEETVDESFSYVIPAGERCDFAIDVDITFSSKLTLFFNKDGTGDKFIAKSSSYQLFSTPDGEVWSRSRATTISDIETGDSFTAGNTASAHAKGMGIVLNDSGRIVSVDGVTTYNGPHQERLGDFEAFCAALAP